MELLVAPAVTHAKFDREVAQFIAQRAYQESRGIWLVEAIFPQAFLVFSSSKLRPPAVVFGALLDFTNYDFWAPSVRLVNPFTRVPYQASELQQTQWLPRAVNGTVQNLVQVHSGGIPFLCMPGVREYHDHPGHSGDSWLLHRRGGEGTFFFIVDQLHKYGVASAQYQLDIGFHLGAGVISE